jgi:hypothetical protein
MFHITDTEDGIRTSSPPHRSATFLQQQKYAILPRSHAAASPLRTPRAPHEPLMHCASQSSHHQWSPLACNLQASIRVPSGRYVVLHFSFGPQLDMANPLPQVLGRSMPYGCWALRIERSPAANLDLLWKLCSWILLVLCSKLRLISQDLGNPFTFTIPYDHNGHYRTQR